MVLVGKKAYFRAGEFMPGGFGCFVIRADFGSPLPSGKTSPELTGYPLGRAARSGGSMAGIQGLGISRFAACKWGAVLSGGSCKDSAPAPDLWEAARRLHG